MARRRAKSTEGGQNKIKTALEQGQSIVGMVGYFYAEELDCYIPLTVQALEINNGDYCGVKLRCSVKGAIGDVLLDPCAVMDDKEAVLKKQEEKKLVEELDKEVRDVLRWHLITQRRASFEKLINGLPEPDKSTILADIETAGFKISRLPDQDLRRYLKAYAQLKYGLENADIPGYHHY